MASDTRPPVNKNGKVRENFGLKQGFHLTDWMKLTQSTTIDLSGLKGGTLIKITPSQLAQHSSKYDCWTSFKGKVYNISNYLQYHPGGEKYLMQGAGKDCTDLVRKYHSWVNIESMMLKCLIGHMIPEPDLCEEVEIIKNEKLIEQIDSLSISNVDNSIIEESLLISEGNKLL